MQRAQVHIVHGYVATPSVNWFPWLANRLRQQQVKVTVFDMPNSQAPEVNEWDKFLDSQITECGPNSYFVGHSLSRIALLRYLNRQRLTKQIGGMVLVSGFLEPVITLPELDGFVQEPFDQEKIIALSPQCTVISSSSDSIVAYHYSQKLTEALQAKFVTVENGGHFLDRVGFTEFPQVYQELREMIERG